MPSTKQICLQTDFMSRRVPPPNPSNFIPHPTPSTRSPCPLCSPEANGFYLATLQGRYQCPHDRGLPEHNWRRDFCAWQVWDTGMKLHEVDVKREAFKRMELERKKLEDEELREEGYRADMEGVDKQGKEKQVEDKVDSKQGDNKQDDNKPKDNKEDGTTSK